MRFQKQSKVLTRMLLLAFLAATLGGTLMIAQAGRPAVPKDGFVPNQETAMRIAEAVWIPLYGKEQIDQEKPFVAELKHDVWIVSGTLHGEAGTISKGGVAKIKISKKDGRVLEVSHGK